MLKTTIGAMYHAFIIAIYTILRGVPLFGLVFVWGALGICCLILWIDSINDDVYI